MATIGALSIVGGPLFILPIVLGALLAMLLVVPRPAVIGRRRNHVLRSVGGALLGAVAGVLVTWLLGDVLNIFGISLTWVVRWADGLSFAAIGIALANLVRTRVWRKIVAVVAALLSVVSLSLVINVDFGQYPTLADALGTSYSDAARLPPVHGDPVPVEEWTPEGGLPPEGTVGRVTIPATESGFPARAAYVYLPPAAYAEDPPALPVVVALSGQPGEPADLFRAAGLDAILDRIAAEHDGVAPIVVAPDQLGDPTSNPMCVDGPAGDSETYLTVDVPDWIRANLAVSTDRRDWAIAGFSQGGTCAIQLGAGHPDLFGSLIDVSGEAAPSLGSVAATIRDGFGGDETAYQAATPEGLLAAEAPYRDTAAFFVAGEDDPVYSANMRSVSALAHRAGMAVTTEVSPGTGHDWNTARFGFRQGFSALLARWAIG